MSEKPNVIAGIHLDLKYLMPRKQYLHRWLSELAGMGINTILLEYEDKFPFKKYPYLRAEDAFTEDELHAFLDVARECDIEIIPLVQTFSHLEFALGHEQLAHLRETPEILTQINPSNPEACAFVDDLLEEIMAYHEDARYIHLGADEAWFVGTNPDYADEVTSMGLPFYWARHLQPYIKKIIDAGKRPILWDDILWKDASVLGDLDLPPETILMAWNYDVRRYEPDSEAFALVDTYLAAGFEVIGAPCLNQGALIPEHDAVWENTAAWGEKARQSNLLGLINTSWAVFHTPLPTQMHLNAQTAAFLQSPVDESWLVQWCENYFALPENSDGAGAFPDALRNLGQNWQQRVQGYGRPITPVGYGYMDLILHFGSQRGRMENGCYPLHWNDVNFPEIYDTKINLVRALEDHDTIATKLDELESAYDSAMAAMQALRQEAQNHQQEAAMFSCFARLRLWHTRALRYLLFNQGEITVLAREWGDLEPELAATLQHFFEPYSAARFMRLWKTFDGPVEEWLTASAAHSPTAVQ